MVYIKISTWHYLLVAIQIVYLMLTALCYLDTWSFRRMLLNLITQRLLAGTACTQLVERCQIACIVRKHHGNHLHQAHNRNET